MMMRGDVAHGVHPLMVWSAERASPDDASHRRENQEAPVGLASFETPAPQAPQCLTEIDSSSVMAGLVLHKAGHDDDLLLFDSNPQHEALTAPEAMRLQSCLIFAPSAL